MAVDQRTFIYITGGNPKDLNKPSDRCLRLDIRNGEQVELPSLINARFDHSSIILNSKLYVMGGIVGFGKRLGSIECFDLKKNFGWYMIVEANEKVERQASAVAAISASQILVYGGQINTGSRSNCGYIFDISSHSVREILGKDRDFSFICLSK